MLLLLFSTDLLLDCAEDVYGVDLEKRCVSSVANYLASAGMGSTVSNRINTNTGNLILGHIQNLCIVWSVSFTACLMVV